MFVLELRSTGVAISLFPVLIQSSAHIFFAARSLIQFNFVTVVCRLVCVMSVLSVCISCKTCDNPVISNSCNYFNEDTLFVDSFLPNSCSFFVYEHQ